MASGLLYYRNKERIFYYLNLAIKRSKHKDTHWSVIAKKKAPKDKALRYFDDLYKGFYGSDWPSIRLALLSPSKYCALVNNFGDTEDTVSNLKELGAVDIRDVFDAESKFSIPSETKRQKRARSSTRKDVESSRTKLLDDRQFFKSSRSDDIEMKKTAEPNKEDTESSESITPSPASLRSKLADPKFEYDRMIKPDIAGSTVSAAALHEFVPATELKGMEDWVLESEHYRHYEGKDQFPINKKEEHNLTYPDHWKVLSFVRGNISRFPSPRRGKTGVFNYYLLDGASVLPVLALDISLGDHVLDMCAAPGGKSLLVLQTLYPELIVSNDLKPSRIERINGVFNDYLFSMKSWKNKVKVTNRDGRDIEDQNIFNKILVDVPCTTDRHSVLEEDNNIFNANRIKERIQLPQIQAALLSNALKIVRPGGTVVYSTCSLSPIQNDGVVHMALKTIWEETDIEVEIRDISPALKVTKNVFKFAKHSQLRYGQVVLPFLANNFGPSYFCKMVKKK